MNKFTHFFFAAMLTLTLAHASTSHAIQPIPSFYEEPGLSPNRDYVNQQANEYIDPFTGKLQLHYVDLFIPGNGGLDIKIQRSYNSLNGFLAEPTALGIGWTMHYGRVLRNAIVQICAMSYASANAPVLELPDGSRQLLYPSFNRSHFITVNRWKAECAPGGMGLIVFSPDGMRYEMTTPGVVVGSPAHFQSSYYTSKIMDRNGNTLSLAYAINGTNTVLTRITSSDGRNVDFTYNGSTLNTVTDGFRTWTYTYGATAGPGYPMLTEVRRPDGARWQYFYNGGPSGSAGDYSLKQMIYPTGGSIEYDYGFVQFNNSLPKTVVVTQKKGVGGTWVYAYSPATQLASYANGYYSFVSAKSMDRTFIVAPDGTHTYYHVGANSVSAGAIWAIGLLLYKSLDSGYQWTSQSWDAQQISNATNVRPGALSLVETGIYAPLTSATNVIRNGQRFTTSFSNFDQYGNASTVTETGTATGNTTDTRTTQLTYEILPAKWIIHLPKDEVINTIGTVHHAYDGNGNLISEDKYGVVTTFGYTSSGDLDYKRDALGNRISYGNYRRGIPQSEAHPEGVNISRVVDQHGNVTSQTDGEGNTTAFTYDGLNRLTSIVHPTGNPVTISWAPNERVVRRGGYTETTDYDGYGRAASVKLDGGAGGSIVQTHAYDSVNRTIFSSYPNQSTGTFFQYDVLGRPYAIYHIAQLNTPSFGAFTYLGGKQTNYYSYNTVQRKDERGLLYTYTYRGYGDPNKLELTAVNAPMRLPALVLR